MKQKKIIYESTNEIPIRMSRATPDELPAAERDLADLLAEIAYRRWQAASPSQPKEKIRD